MFTCCRVAGEVQYAVRSPVKRSVKFLPLFVFLSFFFPQAHTAEKLQLQHWKPSSRRISTRPESSFHGTSFDTLLRSTPIHMLVCSVLPGAFTPPLRFFFIFQTLSSLQSVRGVTSLVRGWGGGRRGGDPRESGSSPGRHFTSVSV